MVLVLEVVLDVEVVVVEVVKVVEVVVLVDVVEVNRQYAPHCSKELYGPPTI